VTLIEEPRPIDPPRGTERTLTLLALRVAEVPHLLGDLLAHRPRFRAFEGRLDARVVVTGVGCSEGPARLLAGLLALLGIRSRFAPLSSFVGAGAGAGAGAAPPAGDTLVVFSQGLSPNATLALDAAGRYARALLLTSLTAADPRLAPHVAAGVEVVTLPPREEEGLLLRVQGPAVASLAACLVAEQIAGEAGLLLPQTDASLVAAIDAARGRVRAPDSWPEGPLGLVTAGEHGTLCRGLTSALVEGLLVPEPPIWDLLSVAHGPFQQFYDTPITLLALTGPGTPPGLLDRLAAMLVPGRHTLLRLEATLPGHLGLLEHQAQLAALLIEGLRRRPRDLVRWPGQGCDGPLYSLGGHTPTGD
jgi:creatinine amidohydrolase